MIGKDKIIHDFDKALKEIENQNGMLKKQLVEKEACMLGLKQDISEANSNNKNLIHQIKSLQEESVFSKQSVELQYSDLKDEKIKLEEKLNQLVDIVKQQSKELFVRFFV